MPKWKSHYSVSDIVLACVSFIRLSYGSKEMENGNWKRSEMSREHDGHYQMDVNRASFREVFGYSEYVSVVEFYKSVI